MSSTIDDTHDPRLTSWVATAGGHREFPIQNLPLGVFSHEGVSRGGVAIGDEIVDLAALGQSGLLEGAAHAAAVAASGATLNPLLALGAEPRRELRRRLALLLSDPCFRADVEPLLLAADQCTLQLPARIGDYTDFYVGIHHARNVGALFRPDNPLLPNYKHVPIGYHGRASSVRASGAEVPRPSGQLMGPDREAPEFAPCRSLDFELELAAWVGRPTELGRPIPIAQASDHIVGLSLLNDWSARDIQAWEYQPLGPFLAKNFLTTVSPWIVTSEALAPFRIAQASRPDGDPAPLPYLTDAVDQQTGAYAIELEVSLSTLRMRQEGAAPVMLSRSHARHMYWTFAQLVAHHSSNGCDLQAGDLLGSGTISAPERTGFGSLLEITRGGADPIVLPTGEKRAFLEDGDEIALSGRLENDGFTPIGFGPCVGLVVGAPCPDREGNLRLSDRHDCTIGRQLPP